MSSYPARTHMFGNEIARMSQLGRSQGLPGKLFTKLKRISRNYTNYLSKKYGKRPQEYQEFIDRVNKASASTHNEPWTAQFAGDEQDVRKFNSLKKALTPPEVRKLARLSYTLHGYWNKNVASAAGQLRDFEGEATNYSNLNNANDYGALQIFRYVAQQRATQSVRVLDLGAGTGGTTESLVHYASKVFGSRAKNVRLEIDCVEQNPGQVKALESKIELLTEKYGGHFADLKINTIKQDFKKTFETLKNKGRKYDAAIASYSFHHLHNEDKKRGTKQVFGLLKKGGVFSLNDCDGCSQFNQRYFNWLSLTRHFSVFQNKEEAQKMLKSSHFEVKDIHKINSVEADQLGRLGLHDQLKLHEKNHDAYFILAHKK